MKGDWTADVVARMHRANILSRELAERCGYAGSYLSTVLHGKRGNEATRAHILAVLSDMESERGIAAKIEDKSSKVEAVKIDLSKVPTADLRNICSTFLESIQKFYSDPANIKGHNAWQSATVQGGKT